VTPASGHTPPPRDADDRPGPAASRLGIAGHPRPVIILNAIVLCVALISVVLGIRLPAHLPTGDPLSLAGRVGIAAALVAAAQLARLRFRLGRGTVSVSWGEAAFILGFHLTPLGWLPAATFVGAATAWLLISAFNEDQPPAEIAHSAASLTLGVTAAATVTGLVAGPAAAGPTGSLTPALALALLAGSLTYLVVTTGLAVLTMALHRDAPVGLILVRIVHGKLPMFVGNVIVGLSAVLVVDLGPAWLLIFPPALWLLQRTYRYHLRAEDERRIWQAFARATRTLGGLSEPDVAAAGVRGALDVFGAQRVELDVAQPDGARRRWAGDGVGDVSEIDPDQQTGRPTGPVVVRSMAIGEAPIGELTVWLPHASSPVGRDALALSAFGDALGGALHDAATHQRLAALSARSSHEAVHDPLTGLANRAALLAEGDALLSGLDRDHQVALLLLDINDFKEVNGTLGHGAGDQLLRVVGERLADLTREHELLARLGDDEFALLLPHLPVLSDSSTPLSEAPSPLPHVVRRARELVEQLSTPTDIAGVRLVTEVAVGVVLAGAGCADLVELIRRAEIAMDQAKASRVSVATYDTSHDAASTDHLALLAELREALHVDDQLVLALQPAVDLETGAPTGVEALSRWRHPRRGMLPPIEFIRTIEHSELLGPFTRYLLDHSLAAATAWSAAGMDLPVSVNVSARSLLDATFPGQVADALRRHRMPAHQLVLEITETVAVSESDIVDEVLAALREVGVQLSVDDFGTGYSSLAFLTRVPVDELKIDRSFVQNMIDSTEAAAIVRSAVDLGRGLHLRVVAEGVETADQRAALIALGCAAAQGYHFCKPQPVETIVAALRSLSENAPARILPLRADGAS
jgi:diguanylate cyclase (GGDEF)-like protein